MRECITLKETKATRLCVLIEEIVTMFRTQSWFPPPPPPFIWLYMIFWEHRAPVTYSWLPSSLKALTIDTKYRHVWKWLCWRKQAFIIHLRTFFLFRSWKHAQTCGSSNNDLKAGHTGKMSQGEFCSGLWPSESKGWWRRLFLPVFFCGFQFGSLSSLWVHFFFTRARESALDGHFNMPVAATLCSLVLFIKREKDWWQIVCLGFFGYFFFFLFCLFFVLFCCIWLGRGPCWSLPSSVLSVLLFVWMTITSFADINLQRFYTYYAGLSCLVCLCSFNMWNVHTGVTYMLTS